MAGLDTDDLNDLENSSTDVGTDFSGNIDASYEKPALDIANAESLSLIHISEPTRPY